MSLITAHLNGASARRFCNQVIGPVRVGKCALGFWLSLRRRWAYAVVATIFREGHWEGFEAELRSFFFFDSSCDSSLASPVSASL